MIWAGTSDGKVHVTRDTGKTWATTAKLAALGRREDAYVSRVRASHHVPGAPTSRRAATSSTTSALPFRTDDFGATWTSIGAICRSRRRRLRGSQNPNLVFVGNDEGVFVSMNGGGRWVKMNNNMPNVPVHDLLVHPRDNDLVVGSYGRGLFITNINALQQLSDTVLTADAHLFAVSRRSSIVRAFAANDYLFGQRNFQTPNEPNGMVIQYYLRAESSTPAAITIANASGQEVARLSGRQGGINTMVEHTRRGDLTASSR